MQDLTLVDVERWPQLPDHAAGNQPEMLVLRDPFEGWSKRDLRGGWLGGVSKVDGDAGALALDPDARLARLLEPGDGVGGPLQRRGVRCRHLHQPRLAQHA